MTRATGRRRPATELSQTSHGTVTCPTLSSAGPIREITLLYGCATTTPPASVADTIAQTPQLSTLNKLVNDSGLGDTLRGPGPFTLFAPTDDAFKAVPAATMTVLGTDKDVSRRC